MDVSKPIHLSQLTTKWSVVRRAHQGPDSDMTQARQQLLERYCKSVYRYLLGAIRDVEVAHDLAQEFAVRFLRGDFHRADPECGRFRDYVRRALSNLVTRYRQRRRQFAPLPDEIVAPEASGAQQADEDFHRSWREEMLNRAWAALEELEKKTGRPVYLTLRLNFEHPHLGKAELAEKLSSQLGRAVTPAGLRQALHRARKQFATFLIEEVAQTLDQPTLDRLYEELADLDLLRYCKSVLENGEWN